MVKNSANKRSARFLILNWFEVGFFYSAFCQIFTLKLEPSRLVKTRLARL